MSTIADYRVLKPWGVFEVGDLLLAERHDGAGIKLLHNSGCAAWTVPFELNSLVNRGVLQRLADKLKLEVGKMYRAVRDLGGWGRGARLLVVGLGPKGEEALLKFNGRGGGFWYYNGGRGWKDLLEPIDEEEKVLCPYSHGPNGETKAYMERQGGLRWL